MGTYGLDGVMGAWRLGTLTTEQAIGQILQIIQQLEARIVELERITAPPRPSNKPASDQKPETS